MKTCEFCGRVNEVGASLCASCGAILKRIIIVNWSGNYPCLCFGQWSIVINGKSLPIPRDIARSNMGTFKTYESWHFEDWQEVFEDYEDGMAYNEWFAVNEGWLIPALNEIGEILSEIELVALYEAINEQDWRSGSCGGCI